ncbi:hypothetical protein ACTXT7_005533 [Hymenolepis weldensis]
MTKRPRDPRSSVASMANPTVRTRSGRVRLFYAMVMIENLVSEATIFLPTRFRWVTVDTDPERELREKGNSSQDKSKHPARLIILYLENCQAVRSGMRRRIDKHPAMIQNRSAYLTMAAKKQKHFSKKKTLCSSEQAYVTHKKRARRKRNAQKPEVTIHPKPPLLEAQDQHQQQQNPPGNSNGMLLRSTWLTNQFRHKGLTSPPSKEVKSSKVIQRKLSASQKTWQTLRPSSSNSYIWLEQDSHTWTNSQPEICVAFMLLKAGRGLKADPVFPKLFFIPIPYENTSIFRPQSSSDAFMSL